MSMSPEMTNALILWLNINGKSLVAMRAHYRPEEWAERNREAQFEAHCEMDKHRQQSCFNCRITNNLLFGSTIRPPSKIITGVTA